MTRKLYSIDHYVRKFFFVLEGRTCQKRKRFCKTSRSYYQRQWWRRRWWSWYWWYLEYSSSTYFHIFKKNLVFISRCRMLLFAKIVIGCMCIVNIQKICLTFVNGNCSYIFYLEDFINYFYLINVDPVSTPCEPTYFPCS